MSKIIAKRLTTNYHVQAIETQELLFCNNWLLSKLVPQLMPIDDVYSHQHLLPSTLGRRGSKIQPPLRGRNITSATIQQSLETPRDPGHVR